MRTIEESYSQENYSLPKELDLRLFCLFWRPDKFQNGRGPPETCSGSRKKFSELGYRIRRGV